MQDIIVSMARGQASDADKYEMDMCPDTYSTCEDAGCIHGILMQAASARYMAGQRYAIHS